jgi:hypothetical protein
MSYDLIARNASRNCEMNQFLGQMLFKHNIKYNYCNIRLRIGVEHSQHKSTQYSLLYSIILECWRSNH